MVRRYWRMISRGNIPWRSEGDTAMTIWNNRIPFAIVSLSVPFPLHKRDSPFP